MCEGNHTKAHTHLWTHAQTQVQVWLARIVLFSLFSPGVILSEQGMCIVYSFSCQLDNQPIEHILHNAHCYG